MTSHFLEVYNHDLATAHHHPRSPYGYTPTTWICILYVVLFSATTAIHIGQTIYFKPRLYWILPTIVTCGICEIIGWGARLWSSRNPLEINAFLIQITTTIIAPTFLTAALYTITGRMITRIGVQYSRLSPKAYLIVLLSANVIALVVQAVGGAKASIAFQNGKPADPGAHIMLGGIFLQLIGICLCLPLAAEFLLRFILQRPIRRKSDVSPTDDEEAPGPVLRGYGILSVRASRRVMALLMATLFVLMRSIYRIIELTGGWSGRIITTEKYFNILDGAPMFLAMFILNLLHPSVLLRP